MNELMNSVLSSEKGKIKTSKERNIKDKIRPIILYLEQTIDLWRLRISTVLILFPVEDLFQNTKYRIS